MFVAGAIGGAAWVLLPAIARVRFNVNEIITTLLLNFVAVYWVIYWAGEPWRDRTSVGGVKSELIPSQAELPELSLRLGRGAARLLPRHGRRHRGLARPAPHDESAMS